MISHGCFIGILQENDMFKLIKLAFLGLVGYAIYELFQGLAGESHQTRGSRGSRDLDDALNSDDGRMGALTGEGVGQVEQTLDGNGTSIPHRVGRGVVKAS